MTHHYHSHKNGIVMGGRYLKAYRTTKMASGKDDFLYGDEFDAVLAIIDADMFENDDNLYQKSTL